MVVADTDVLIDALERGREPSASRVAALIRRGELATSAVTLYELTAGSRTTAAQLELLHAELGPIPVLGLTRGAADLAAAVNRALARRGEGIAIPDTLIAGTCLAYGCSLLTRNVAHFARVPGLVLEPL